MSDEPTIIGAVPPSEGQNDALANRLQGFTEGVQVAAHHDKVVRQADNRTSMEVGAAAFGTGLIALVGGVALGNQEVQTFGTAMGGSGAYALLHGRQVHRRNEKVKDGLESFMQQSSITPPDGGEKAYTLADGTKIIAPGDSETRWTIDISERNNPKSR